MRATNLSWGAVLLLAGCLGGIDPGGSDGNGGGNANGSFGSGDPNAAGPMALRRLTRAEYDNTVRDLLGDQSHPGDKFPDDLEDDFVFRRAGAVATLDADRLREAAEQLAAAVDPTTLAPCSGDETACAQGFITRFGLRAFRRPVADDEASRLLELYQAGRATLGLDYGGGIQLLVEAMLQSPAFVYHWERGPQPLVKEGNVVRLGAYELASRLSYFLWRSMPDQALFDDAAADRLSDDADVERQIRRMLDDPKARAGVAEFFQEWLGLDQVAGRPKDLSVYPEWNDALKAAMTEETRQFVDHVVFDGDGRLDTLLTASFSYVNQSLAPVYGVSAAGTDFEEVSLDPAQRSGGLLTQAGFLTLTGSTDGSHPVKRGRKVYERILCGTLPAPPNSVPAPAPASAGGSTRQRFEAHDQQACAKGCHSLIDPIGFAFEHYDGLGHFRTTDNGVTVDAKSKYTIDGKEQSFDGAIELAGILAASATVHDCFVKQWTRYALLRTEQAEDTASLNFASAAFSDGKDSIRELLVGLAMSRTFRYRSLAQGEL